MRQRKPTTKPRNANFYGMTTTAHINDDGTWLEPEELCYPNGGMTRKAYALCEDGIMRIVRCGLPDGAWTISGNTKIGGKSVRGYLTFGDIGLRFYAYKNNS